MECLDGIQMQRLIVVQKLAQFRADVRVPSQEVVGFWLLASFDRPDPLGNRGIDFMG